MQTKLRRQLSWYSLSALVLLGATCSAQSTTNQPKITATENESIDSSQTVNVSTDISSWRWQFQNVVVGQSAGNETEVNVLMSDVIRLTDGSYRMYYNAGGKGKSLINYAESADGKTNWTVKGTALTGGSNSTDDDYIMGGSRVIALADGTYRMYYRATPDYTTMSTPSYSIYLATSADGKTFTKTTAVIPNTREDATSNLSLAGHGAFYQLADGTYAAFFSGNTVDTAKAPSDLFFTTSIDGLIWDEPTMLYRGVHDPTVIKTDDGYIVAAMHLKDWVGAAYSGDGTTWPTQLTQFEITSAEGGSLDLNVIGDINLAAGADGSLNFYTNYNSGSDHGIAYYTDARE